MNEMVREAAARCRAVILFGEAAGKIEGAFRAEGATTPLVRVETLEEAVDAARNAAQEGDVVLLSPACTSYDAYENFEQRGEQFRVLVRQMIKEVAPSLR
jgi:UDP-N-acetylmuramoylalanine--D-glutamate ligase